MRYKSINRATRYFNKLKIERDSYAEGYVDDERVADFVMNNPEAKKLDLSDCSNVKSLPSLSTMRKLSDVKMANCRKLGGQVVLPNSVKEFKESAFLGCERLERLEAPKLSKAGSLAFAGCEKLKTMEVHLTDLGDNTFVGCKTFLGEEAAGRWNNIRQSTVKSRPYNEELSKEKLANEGAFFKKITDEVSSSES